MLEIFKNKLLIPFYLLGFGQVVICLFGLYGHYSPIPFWDMWNGYLEFYTHILNGEYKYIFLQHNEHRIIFTKILFMIDMALFGGKSYFLLIVNIFLMILIIYQLFKFIDKIYTNKTFHITNLIKLFIFIILFSWVQHENITWGFQSQFYLAYLVPLFSFYLLAVFKETGEDKYFFYSCIVAALSAYTMANGVLASLLLIVMALLFRLAKIKVFIALCMAILNYIVFFNGYKSIDRQGNIIQYLLDAPIDFIVYVLTYLGSPFFYLFGHNIFIAQLFGFLLIFGMLILVVKYFRTILTNYFLISIVMQQVYILATALVTASGRFSFGIEQAISSRYTTPALMAWSIFFILLFYFLNDDKKYVKHLKYGLIFFISIIFVVYQFKALKSQNDMKLERNLGALAISMNVKDVKAIQRVCPSPEQCIEIGNLATQYKISIFDAEMYGVLSSSLNKQLQIIDLDKVYGYIDNVQEISNKTYKVNGWFFDMKTSCDKLMILNEENYLLGYAIRGYVRDDLVELYGKNALTSGFVGYFKSNQKFDNLKVQCLENSSYIKNKVTIESKQVIYNSYEKNKVFSGTNLEGYVIFGSYINGDIDFAKMKIKYTSDLLYKTGPKSEYQKVLIYEGERLLGEVILSVSNEWKRLDISLGSKRENLDLVFIDESDNWGEWSAFAIRKDNNESK